MIRQSHTAMRIYMAMIASAVWFALLLQFPLTISTSRANGMTIIGAIITYFSFYTILTNLLVALGLSFCLWMPTSALGSFFGRPLVTSGTAVYIAVVGAGYSLLLRHSWNPEGFQKIADIFLHDVVPAAYVVYWLIFASRSALRWKSVLLWLIYPLTYLSYVLVRGALSGRYPYPFIDAGKLGYSRAFSNVAMLLGGFLGVSLLVVAVSRWLSPNSRAGNQIPQLPKGK